MKRAKNTLTSTFVILAFFSLTLTICSADPIQPSASLRCIFTTNYHFGTLRSLYTCEISGRMYINQSNTTINKVEGDHILGRRNTDVFAFKGDAQVINYFPRDLNKAFPNLLAILLNLVHLKEIHQADIRPFTELKYLDLFENKIEYLEADLFKYNTKLELIWLSNNKIKFIDDTAFDGIIGLRSLYLGYNECVSKSIADNKERISFLYDLIKIQCGNKSKNSKFNPKNGMNNQDDYDDDSEPQPAPNADSLNETESKIKSLTTQLRAVEDEVFKLKKRREQALIWLVQMEDENRLLKKAQNDSLIEIGTLKDKIQKSESNSVDYVRQIFGLREDLRKQTDATSNLVSDLKNKMNEDEIYTKNLRAEYGKLRDENSKILEENRKVRENFENLMEEKNNRDMFSMVAIIFLALGLIGLVGFNFYKKMSAAPTLRTYNDFENATIKLVGDGASSSIN